MKLFGLTNLSLDINLKLISSLEDMTPSSCMLSLKMTIFLISST